MDLNLNLAEAQRIMCDMIDGNRSSISQGYFTWNGAQWDCDQISRANIIGTCVLALANGGNLPPGTQWRDYNNNMVLVTGAEMIQLGVAMFTHLTSVYGASWQHKANVMALTTTADVAAYDYLDTLWPIPPT